jgi:predicted nucleotidyltransferase
MSKRVSAGKSKRTTTDDRRAQNTLCNKPLASKPSRKIEEALSSVSLYLNPIRVVVFGSYLSDKQEPSDIDVIIAGDYIRFPEGNLSKLLPAAIDARLITRSGVPDPLPTAPEIVRAFNEDPQNLQSGIFIDDYVEVRVTASTETSATPSRR